MANYRFKKYTTLFSGIGVINLQPSYGFTSLDQAVNTLVSVVFFFGGLAAFFYLLMGAVKYIIAGSDEEKIKGARATMVHAVVGLIILGMVMVIFQIIIETIPGLDQYFSFS